MEQNKLPNNNEIENEKQTLQQEIKKLDIYNNCNNYGRDQLLCYFPNRATEIRECFLESGAWCFFSQDKKGQLQEIIMKELCLLLYPYIEKGYKVKKLDSNFCDANLGNVICLEQPNSMQYIGISIGKRSKMVSTNVAFYDDEEEGHVKKRCLHNSGIRINYDKISIYNCDMDYTFIIYPDNEDIKLTDFADDIKRKIFYGQNNKIFQNTGDIIHFFSTLSFTEIEQVLQILNKHLKDKKYDEVDIKKVLEEIKNTIEENRKEEKKNEENSINNNLNNSNNLNFSGNDLNKDLNQNNTFVNVNNINNIQNNKNNIIKKEPIIKKSNEINKNENKNSNDDITKTKLEIKEEDKTSHNCCITCLKQCWPFSEKGK